MKLIDSIREASPELYEMENDEIIHGLQKIDGDLYSILDTVAFLFSAVSFSDFQSTATSDYDIIEEFLNQEV